MARQGRPPKPTALKVIEGNPGKRSLRESPKPPPSRPRRPQWLVGYARAEWDRIIPELDRRGLLDVVDRNTIAGYCISVGQLKDAYQDLNRRGQLIPSARKDGDLVKNPSNQLLRDALRQIANYSSMFGLSPSDRVRLTGDAGYAGEELGLDAILRG